MKRDEFLQVIRSPFHFATCDAVLRGCKIVDISKPPQWRRMSKKVRSPLDPLCEGTPPAGGGGENCTAARNISGYGKVFSLRPFGAPPSQREVFRHAGLPHRGKLSAKRTDAGRVAGNIPFTGNSANFALIRPRFARPPSPDGEGFLFFIASPPARLRARRGAPRASKRRSASGCGQTAAGG